MSGGWPRLLILLVSRTRAVTLLRYWIPEPNLRPVFSHLLSVLRPAGGTTLNGATYTYDATGNRTSQGTHRLRQNRPIHHAYSAIKLILRQLGIN